MYDTILVPLDGSDLAENALRYARKIAAANDSRLVLMRASKTTEAVVDLLGQLTSPVITAEQLKGSAEQYLDFVAMTQAHSNTVTYVHAGNPASVILDCEQAECADLIVMSTHGRSGVGRWALGSVAEKVLQKAQVPVLLVRDRRPIKRILVPLDGSPHAEAVLRHAVQLAEVFEAELTLLRVAKRDVAPVSARQVATLLNDAIKAIPPAVIEPDQDERYLEITAQNRIPEEIPVTFLERTGDAAETILQIAKEHDLIAMSTHGYSGLERYMFGSVMEKVLRATDRPMLVVRPWL